MKKNTFARVLILAAALLVAIMTLASCSADYAENSAPGAASVSRIIRQK